MKIPGFENEPFVIEEFVPKEIFKKFGANSIWFMDYHVVKSIVYLRHWYGAPMTLNNWHTGGNYNSRVFRMPDDDSGASLSQHKCKCATDFNVKGLTGSQAGRKIIDNWDEISMNVIFTTIENPEMTRRKLPDGSWSNGWTHLDGRWTGLNDLLIVNP